ncbi:MAG: outer membrane protein assembly factor BamA [Candidatus Dadabacteria bacterium]|nr:outer membrane protein assembly factor BamA [Candidatus Dadabacteria bacterium]
MLNRAILLILCGVALFFAAPVAAQEEVVVSQLRIEGNSRITDDFVETVVSQRAGAPYDEDKVAEDIRKLYATGKFYDISVEKETLPSGVALTYNLLENPVLVDLSFSGNKKIEDSDLEEGVGIKENTMVGTGDLHEGSKRIRQLYAAKGHSGAEVSYNIEPEADAGINVTYKVKEGPRDTISSVRISGNEDIKTKTLKKRIFSSPRRFYSLGQRGLFILEEVEKDTERIKFAYLGEGYLDVKVSTPQIEYNEEEKSYAVLFNVQEGEKYFVADILFDGLDSAPPEVNRDEVLYKIALKKGEPYGNGKMTSAINFLTALYTNQGYANVNVEPSVTKQTTEDGKPGVAVLFTIEKGGVFRIGRINILGNDKTVDKVIRRQIPIVEGDIYKSGDIAAIRPLVGRLGFFDPDSLQVTNELSKDRENELDVDITLSEASTAQFNLGAGISSVEDFIFFGSIREANLFGTGKTVEASANFGNITDTYSLRYSDRNFFDTDWTFDLSLARVERDYVDYDSLTTGTTIGIGKSLYRQLWGRVYYRWENLEISNPSEAAQQQGIVESTGIISGIGADISWDNRDNYQFPTSGYRTILLYEHSGPFGGDTDLSKLVFETNMWIPVFKGAFFAMKIRYDRVFLRGEGNSHAVDELLYLGGASDLRGFDYRELTVGGGGGTERIYAKNDLIVPLLKPLGIYGVLFYNMGNVFDSGRGEPLSVNPSNLRKDFGYGFWWRSPLGLVKIEVGYPIDRRPFEERRQVNFSIGAAF